MPHINWCIINTSLPLIELSLDIPETLTKNGHQKLQQTSTFWPRTQQKKIASESQKSIKNICSFHISSSFFRQLTYKLNRPIKIIAANFFFFPLPQFKVSITAVAEKQMHIKALKNYIWIVIRLQIGVKYVDWDDYFRTWKRLCWPSVL